VVEDDGVPYILMGDGAADNGWTLGFYVSQTGSNPVPDPATPDDPDASLSGEGGGGCNQGAGVLMAATLLTAFLLNVRGRTGNG
jgi:hypothetical protein